jgi:hypothetical protein
MKNFHYGHGVMVAMAAFILIMAHFMVRAINNQEELVAQDYYAQELRYQQRIEQLERTMALGRTTVEARKGELVITLPTTVHQRAVSGELYLMRTNNARLDHRATVQASAEGRVVVDTSTLPPGAYLMQFDWAVDGKDYFTEERVHLP